MHGTATLRGEEVVVNFGSAGPSAEPFRTDLAALRVRRGCGVSCVYHVCVYMS